MFEFEDCFDGGAFKVVVVVKKFIEIFLGMFVKGVLMSIFMFGYSVSEKLKVLVFKDVDDIEALIDAYDVVYVFMDICELRWFLMLICVDKGKFCINIVFGFNIYFVMWYGCGVDYVSLSRFGCYFCNDVMVSANSIKDCMLD